jgi:hypothetical protein
MTAVLVFAVAGVFAHCGNSLEPTPDMPTNDGGPGGGTTSEGSIESDGSNQGQGGTAPAYSDKCGVVDCVPDDEDACMTEASPGAGGTGSEDDDDLDTAAGGASSSGAGGQGGVSNDEPAQGGASPSYGGEGGSSAGLPADGDGGTPSSGGAPTSPVDHGASCQVSIVKGKPRAACAPAGAGDTNAPCFSNADCLPGRGCVQEGAAARCLPSCCAGDSVCGQGSYCAERPLANAGEEPHQVPVCVPADDCNLNEPFPCGDGGSCSCEQGKACLVVRSDGTTTCATPGMGKAGESCPCAWGYVCSQATEACVRLCETARAVEYCGNSQCQASAELPLGWGVCLSPEDASVAK